MRDFRKIPPGGPALVWTAVLVFAAANSVVQLLSNIGAANPVEGRNAISFCNVLFVGNFCACLTLIAIYRRQWTRQALSALTRADWLSLLVLAGISGALAPALIFLAIEKTTVTSVVLVGRIEPPLFLVLSMLFLHERADRWTASGSVITLAGVGTIVWLQRRGNGVMVGEGELYAFLGAVALAVSTVISKTRLNRIPLGIFSVVRTGLGAVFFFVAAAWLFGIGHFMDAASPVLWKWMPVYGAVIVAGGQLAWFSGIARTPAPEVSLATSFSPVGGVAFAWLLLGERPDMAVLVGGAVIVAGIAVGQVGGRLFSRRATQAPEQRETIAKSVEFEGRTGFRGV